MNKVYVQRYDDETWFLLVHHAVEECEKDGVQVSVLNVEERLTDLFGFKIGKIYETVVTCPDGTTRNAYEACHKKKIRKALKRLNEILGA